MKLYYDTRVGKSYELQTKAFFIPLMTYLQKHHDCTLRQLNTQFPQKGFVKYLESCIEAGWIFRKERRYGVALPFYTQAKVEEVWQQPQFKELFSQLTALADSELAALLQQLKDCQPPTPYLVADDVVLGHLQEAGLAGELQLFSLVTKTSSADLAGFFVANRHLEEPERYEALARLIGDVDEEYYFQQVQWILSRVGKGKEPKASIFQESLQVTGILSGTNQLQIPYLRNLTESADLISKITSLNHFEMGVLLGEICEKRFNGLFQWFYKEKILLKKEKENN